MNADLDSDLAAANEQIENLSMLVVRLARQLRHFEKDSALATKALDYLKRNGLMPSVLREDEP